MPGLTREQVVQFIRSQTLGVVSTLGPGGEPQAALVGIAVTDDCELVFDTVESSRKATNLRHDARVGVVVGGTMQDERTLQADGVADVPAGSDREHILDVYLARFPDGRGRLSWPGITHVRIRPRWLRYSDFNQVPPLIVEIASDPDGVLRFSD